MLWLGGVKTLATALFICGLLVLGRRCVSRFKLSFGPCFSKNDTVFCSNQFTTKADPKPSSCLPLDGYRMCRCKSQVQGFVAGIRFLVSLKSSGFGL